MLTGRKGISLSAEFDGSGNVSCVNERQVAIYRGMLLAHAGYYLFTAKQELGWTKYETPIGLEEFPNRQIARFGRAAVMAWWSPNSVSQLFEAIGTIRNFPAQKKRDLAHFLIMLREFRRLTERLQNRASEELRSLIERSSDSYFYKYLAFRSRDADGKEEPYAGGKGLIYDEFSEELRLLLNKVRDPSEAEINECMSRGIAPQLLIGTNIKTKIYYLLPIKYMVTFWLRRQSEGTVELADYAIEIALNALSE